MLSSLRRVAFWLSISVCAGAAPAQVTPSSDVSTGLFPFLVGNLDGQEATIAQQCLTRGMDTLYVSIFRATGPLQGDLWITDQAGTWQSSWGPIRSGGAGIRLVELIDACHARSVRVVGVMKCFDDTVQPTSQAHRNYLLDVVDSLVHAYDASGSPIYDLDGIALDYVRYVQNGSGNDATQITNFVADVKARLGVLTLHAYLPAGRFTFDGPTYNGNFNSYSSVINSNASQYGQDWAQMARHVDVMMPMTYTANGSIYSTYSLHQSYVAYAAQVCRTACTLSGTSGQRVTPVMKTYTSSGETTTAQTVDASVTGALLGGADGYQAFRYFTTTTAWWTVLQQHAVAGANWPLPGLQATVTGLTASVDASTSSDPDQSAATLDWAVDTDGDGIFDTPWMPTTMTSQWMLPPGTNKVGFGLRDNDGHVAHTTRQLSGRDILTLSTPSISGFLGDHETITVDAGPSAAGATYVVLASLSGSTPGTLLAPGFEVPIVFDFATTGLYSAANTPLFPGGIGLLDASGVGTATFAPAPRFISPLAFSTVTWAAFGIDAQGQGLFVTNPATMLILP